MERRALAIDPGSRRRAHVARLGAARARAHRRGDRGDPRSDPPRSRQRPGAPGAGARALGRQGGFRRRDSGVRARDRAQSGGRLLVPAARAAAGVGRPATTTREEICRRAVELQDQYISGNAGLQIVGANARLGYVHYLQGRYEEALREYERELAFVGVQRPRAEGAHPDRAERQDGRGVSAQGPRRTTPRGTSIGRSRRSTRGWPTAPTIRSPATTSPAVHALRGDADRALDSLERVAAALPALTAARARRDPDLESLRDDSAVRGDCRDLRSCQRRTHQRLPTDSPMPVDVIIVGAGPAGLSAALILGRCRRTVLVCDTGQPRNAASHAHARLPDAATACRRASSCDGAPRSSSAYDTVQLRDVERRGAACQPTAAFTVTLATARRPRRASC